MVRLKQIVICLILVFSIFAKQENIIDVNDNCTFNKTIPQQQNPQKMQKNNRLECLTNYQNFYKHLSDFDQQYQYQYYNSSFSFLDTYILTFKTDSYISKSEARFMNRDFNDRGQYIFQSLNNQVDKQIIEQKQLQKLKNQIKANKQDRILDDKYQNSPYLIQQLVQNSLFNKNCQVLLHKNQQMTTAIYLGCKNSKDISYTLESKIKAAITYSILSVEKVLKAKQPQIIGFEFEINDNLEPFVKQISIVDNPKLIKAIKDKQVCNLPENNKCEVILDTLQNINFIQSHQFQIRKWNVPKMNQVKYHQLIDEFGQPLSNIKTFHSNRLQSFNVVSKHLKRRGLKNTQIKNNSSFKHGLVYTSTIEFDNKKKYTNQLTYSINAVWPSFLSDKFKLIKSLKEFDKLQPYNNVYNSSFINPLQYQIDFRNLSQPLSKDETEVLNLENKGMWILKSAQGMKGIGIELIYDLKDIQEAIKLKRDHHQLTDKLNIKNHKSFHRYFTLQKYIENPLLQDGKKFDSRQFILIVSSDPLIVVYQTGYTRKTLVDYHRFSKSKYTHLGNGDIQKELPGYKQKVQKNHNYLREEFKAKLIKEYPEYNQGSFELMEEKTKAGITYAIKAALNQNPNVRKGDTEIISVDMVIDENLNAFITEFNRNPYLGTSQSVLAQFFPSLGEDFADATLALHAMEHDEIIARSRENPFFICDIMKKIYNCKDNVLINDAVGYSYLDHVDIQSYKYPEYKIYEEKDREQYQKDRKQRKRKILK